MVGIDIILISDWLQVDTEEDDMDEEDQEETEEVGDRAVIKPLQSFYSAKREGPSSGPLLVERAY